MTRTLTALTFVSLVVVLGCGDGDSQKTTTRDSQRAAEATRQQVESSTKPVETEQVTLVGTRGCGHCTFHKGESCAAALQTADGKVYILDGFDSDSEMFQNRMDGAKVKVTGVLTQRGADTHVAVASHEIL